MNFWELVGSVLASLGGAACIVVLTIKFAGNMIAERLSKKYDLKLEKELESFKSALNKEQLDFQGTLDQKLEKLKGTLEKKNYISKARFDAELQTYRELSKTFFDMIMAVGTAIESPDTNMYVDIEDSQQYISKCNDFLNTQIDNSFKAAYNALNYNALFICEEFYDAYKDILTLTIKQIQLLESKEERINEINELNDRAVEKHTHLNQKIRDYLLNLDVIE